MGQREVETSGLTGRRGRARIRGRSLRTVLIVVSLAVSAVLGIASAAVAGSDSADRRVVRVGIYDNPPLVFVDRDGKVKGIYPDLLGDVAAREGWELRYVTGTFDEGLKRLESGDIDAMTAIAYTDERAKRYVFTDVTVLANWGQVYVPERGIQDVQGVESVLDLAGKRIAVVKGDVYYEGLSGLFQQFGIQADFVEVDEYVHILEALEGGDADVGVVSRIYGHQNAERFAVQSTPVVVKPVQLRFALSKHSPENVRLAERVDARLRLLKDTPGSLYYDSVNHWLGETPSERRSSQRLLWGLVAAMLLLGGAVAFGVLLRLQVRARTAELERKTADLEREVANRKQAQQALAESEARFKTIVQTADQGVLLGDVETLQLRPANPAICDMLGYTAEEIDDLTIHDIHPPEALPDVIAHFQALARGEYTLASDIPVLRKDGSVFFADISSSTMFLEGRETLVGFFRDVTAKRELEQLKSDFLSMVSHELRTPLAVIIGHATLIDRLTEGGLTPGEGDGGLTERLLRSLAIVRSRGAEMHRMVDQLLSVMNIETGSLVLRKELVRTATLVERALDILPDRNRELVDIVVDDDVPAVTCDPELLARAISNLLDNAVKFSPPGSRVRLTAQTHDGRVRISVTDRGVGIDAEDLPRLFERFTQLDMSARRKYGGVGMGLFIVKTVVEAHGGRVDIVSAPGEGSTFTIDLPAAEARS